MVKKQKDHSNELNQLYDMIYDENILSYDILEVDIQGINHDLIRCYIEPLKECY